MKYLIKAVLVAATIIYASPALSSEYICSSEKGTGYFLPGTDEAQDFKSRQKFRITSIGSTKPTFSFRRLKGQTEDPLLASMFREAASFSLTFSGPEPRYPCISNKTEIICSAGSGVYFTLFLKSLRFSAVSVAQERGQAEKIWMDIGSCSSVKQ
ncbi:MULTISPECIES: hypothetical protein [unclassified Pseudovibrio]|uniref:hypothetical protein n=1 Tax=unclassified Pseudovibrio TaxID=2627060 RepID=UPI0007AE689A|nr:MULTISPECIES: hypothetical protein [unclassified Pseudovibrio]KZK85757.1 hypothetical protein PsAD46_03348 [Pseudovibrio sp. Ad46]KZL10698.1 hypothetical protein PsAD26_03063 [Pseudovibrio sp. Ad26]